jgi:glycosyltransferase involved in cell wall biosynthesis
MSQPRIALVHDRLTEWGGAENVLAEFLAHWPDATVYSPIVDPDVVRSKLGSVQDTWLSGAYARAGKRSYAPLLPLVPRELRHLPLDDRFDVALLSHFAFATQAALATNKPAVAYVHTPARWAWDSAFRAQEGGGRAGQLALRGLATMSRRCELRAAPRLARVIANSEAVADRIRDWWGLEPTVINPPVRVHMFTPDPDVEREDFFLVAGRLVPYKRSDLAIRAAQRAGVRIVVVGAGRFRSYLDEIAGPETTFLGSVPHSVLVDNLRRCRALVMPGVEDFGIVPVEAMATGTPVLAVGEGGALDYVRPGVTGEFIKGGSDDEIIEHLARTFEAFQSSVYPWSVIRNFAESFAPENFRSRVADVVNDALNSR